MTLALIFRVLFIMGGILAVFWLVLLGFGGLRGWQEKKDRRMRALVGLSPERQQLLWSLHHAGPAPSSAVDPRPAFHACREAGIEEWRVRAFEP